MSKTLISITFFLLIAQLPPLVFPSFFMSRSGLKQQGVGAVVGHDGGDSKHYRAMAVL